MLDENGNGKVGLRDLYTEIKGVYSKINKVEDKIETRFEIFADKQSNHSEAISKILTRQDTHSWVIKTTLGAIILATVGILFAAYRMSMSFG